MAARKKPVMTEMVSARMTDLKPYDKNPRIGDISVIAESLEANGQFKPIVVQKSTSKILAGNHTFLAARKLGWKTISAVVIDVDDEEAKRIVLADNRTSDFGGYDEDVLAELLDSIEVPEGTGYSMDDIESLTASLRDLETAVEEDDEEPEEEESGEWDDLDDQPEGVTGLRDDMVWLPCYDPTNDYEMPELLDEMIADISGANIDTWVGPDFSPQNDAPDKQWLYMVRVSTTGIPWERAIVGFFTRDYRFESWWDDPARHTQRILNLGVERVLEPDFTTSDDMPVAVDLWQVYRQRWLARYFQEAGLEVIPNYGTIVGDDARKPYVLPGFPVEPASGCIQLQSIGNGDDEILTLASAISKCFGEWSRPKTLLVYGGDKARKVMDRVSYDGEVIFATPYTALRMKLIEDRRKDTGGEALTRVSAIGE